MSSPLESLSWKGLISVLIYRNFVTKKFISADSWLQHFVAVRDQYFVDLKTNLWSVFPSWYFCWMLHLLSIIRVAMSWRNLKCTYNLTKVYLDLMKQYCYIVFVSIIRYSNSLMCFFLFNDVMCIFLYLHTLNENVLTTYSEEWVMKYFLYVRTICVIFKDKNFSSNIETKVEYWMIIIDFSILSHYTIKAKQHGSIVGKVWIAKIWNFEI